VEWHGRSRVDALKRPGAKKGSFLGSFLGVTRKPHTKPRGPSRSETASSRSWYVRPRRAKTYPDKTVIFPVPYGEMHLRPLSHARPSMLDG